MIIYTKSMMKYITILLLAVFLIPLAQNVNAQSILDQLSGGIKNLTSGAGQSMNNTASQAGQSTSNASSQNNSSSGNPIMDMLKKIIPGQK